MTQHVRPKMNEFGLCAPPAANSFVAISFDCKSLSVFVVRSILIAVPVRNPLLTGPFKKLNSAFAFS